MAVGVEPWPSTVFLYFFIIISLMLEVLADLSQASSSRLGSIVRHINISFQFLSRFIHQKKKDAEEEKKTNKRISEMAKRS